MYQRDEHETVKAFYKLYADWMESTPDDLAAFVSTLANLTGLPRSSDDYPVANERIQSAAAAFQNAAKQCYRFDLDLDTDDPAQIDRFAERHLIDPAWRAYFTADSEERSEDMLENVEAGPKAPNEPLLYYCMGAFWGEWQVRHRQACWKLYGPLNPVQSFPDMISSGVTICSHPFSQVCKKLCDPEGDNLSYKCHVGQAQKRYLPPYPLLVSLTDTDHAVRQLLAEPAQRALDAEKAGDDVQAWELFCEAALENDEVPQLLARMITCAWRLEKFDMVDGLSQKLLGLAPDHPQTCHNLAVLYSGQPDLMPEAIQLLETAVEADPNYARARLTLASCLAESGRMEEAKEHVKWVVENDAELKDEAIEFLAEL